MTNWTSRAHGRREVAVYPVSALFSSGLLGPLSPADAVSGESVTVVLERGMGTTSHCGCVTAPRGCEF